MKIKIILYFSILSLIGCNFQKSSEQEANGENQNYLDVLHEKEAGSINNDPENLGILLTTIEFGIKANQDELKDFEDGIVPWISIESPESEIDRLIDANTIVIPYSEVTLVIDYPLNNPASFVLKSTEKGFTKKQLILDISKKYHEIYKTEEKTAKTKTVPLEKREGLINRNETDGTYGVWGHDIGDLDLSSIEVYQSANEQITILLGIES